jgi:hypothetical protein
MALVPGDEAYEARLADRQCRAQNVDRMERTVSWNPSRSLEETLRDVVKSYAVPHGSHG